jgi:SAM-dependent methyltransferase
LPRDPRLLFQDAYSGDEQRSAMSDFAQRVRQRDALIADPSLWFWTPAFDEVLSWLKKRVRPGGTVLELGCGLGFFLHAMRRDGFNAVGLDVAELVVDLNTRDGFQERHGPLETMPDGWVKPDAVVAFFMLHHLEEPERFLQLIRERWPQTPLGIAQYGPNNRSVDRSSPPRNLTRWNQRSMGVALEHAGYSPQVTELASTGVEGRLLTPARSALFEWLVSKPTAYRIAKRTLSAAAAGLLKPFKPLRSQGFVVLAFGEPTGK